MKSGEFEIKENKKWNPVFGERTIVVELCVVVDDHSEKSSEKFFEELKELLDRYAI